MPIKETSPFIHLHVHTEYSLLDGAIRIPRLLERCRKFNMPAVAITDHGTMFGAADFYKQATDAGIKPIIGCECYVAPRSLRDKTPADHKRMTHLVLLAQNREGYHNLCRLATYASLDGFYHKPRIDKEVLAAHKKGLIGLSACLKGEIAQRIIAHKEDEALEAARFYADLFGDGNFFLEVQKNGLERQERVNAGLFEISKKISLPMVATNDCHYLDREDERAHEVLLCIQTGKTMKDENRFRFGSGELFFKSPEIMADALGAYPDAVSNTLEIADRCNIEFDFETYHFPRFANKEGLSESDLFEKNVRAGFEKRMATIRKKNPEVDESVYRTRIDYELSVIIDMKFPGYFLIVADFIEFAKKNAIPVGPGRGSAAGSLVSYSLGITDLDPIEHGLIFERFLNPARSSMPDIDVDFCINGRETVFKYVVDKYGGPDYVSQIITFGTMKARAVIRDVGRALDIPLRVVDEIAKLVPDDLNISLEKAIKKEPKLAERAGQDPEIAELIEISKRLEGLSRHASTHAAGVVIGDRPLVEYLPLLKGKKGEVLTQFDKIMVEKIGLVKFDFLGLRTLTVIEEALSNILGQGKTPPDMGNLDFTDESTYRLLMSGRTTGLFQLESTSMKGLIIQLKPESLNEITALVALHRPGPMGSGMVETYVDCKHGRKKVEYLVPQLEPILKNTYGVILYQEQVMRIAVDLAGYEMSEADNLRKAMGKKKKDVMAKESGHFIEGSVRNGIPAKKAEAIFKLIETFAGYGFNKSHSAAYAVITFQTAYLKTHFPVEFMAAALTSEMNDADKFSRYIAECREMGIDILPPDVNESRLGFTVVDNKIRFGLGAVKNVGENAIVSILETRKEGPFVSLFDFARRVDSKKVNKRVFESLVQCGAFVSTGYNRAQLMAAVETAVEYGQRIQKEKMDPQMSLFGGMEEAESINPPTVPDIPEWDKKQILELEKEIVGFYISGHPLGEYRGLIEKYASTDSLTIREEVVKDGQTVRLCGIVRNIKSHVTRKGDPMAFINIEDINSDVEVVVFPRVYAESENSLISDTPVFVQGKVSKDEKSAKIIADNIVEIDQVEEKWAASLHVNIDASRFEETFIDRLHDVFKRYPGSSNGFFHLRLPQKKEVILALPDSMKVQAGVAIAREIDDILGYPAVETVCSPIQPSRSDNGNHRRNWKSNKARGRS